MRTTFLFVLLTGLPFLLPAQTRHDALLIEGYGATYDIPDADFPADPERVYMMLFDVLDSPGAPEDLNIKLNTVARFLNMHARAGVPPENLKVAVVLHGGAAKDALTDEAYQRHYQSNNPNRELLEKLRSAGVRLFLCGQSAAKREFGREEIAEPIDVALSAMTVIATLGAEGYQVVNW